jgi:hypothetical protein
VCIVRGTGTFAFFGGSEECHWSVLDGSVRVRRNRGLHALIGTTTLSPARSPPQHHPRDARRAAATVDPGPEEPTKVLDPSAVDRATGVSAASTLAFDVSSMRQLSPAGCIDFGCVLHTASAESTHGSHRGQMPMAISVLSAHFISAQSH